MIPVLLDLLGAGFVLVLTALAFPILKHYIIAWLDERRAGKQPPSAQPSHTAVTQPSAQTVNGSATANNLSRLNCPECQLGHIIEDRSGAICGRCGAGFSAEQLTSLRVRQVINSVSFGDAANTSGSVAPESTPSVATPQRRYIDLVLDDVKIGWMETYFVTILGSLRQGPVDAYYLPNPLEPEKSEFIAYFTTLDKAHAAIEKAYLKAQHKQQKQKAPWRASSELKSQRRP